MKLFDRPALENPASSSAYVAGSQRIGKAPQQRMRENRTDLATRCAHGPSRTRCRRPTVEPLPCLGQQRSGPPPVGAFRPTRKAQQQVTRSRHWPGLVSRSTCSQNRPHPAGRRQAPGCQAALVSPSQLEPHRGVGDEARLATLAQLLWARLVVGSLVLAGCSYQLASGRLLPATRGLRQLALLLAPCHYWPHSSGGHRPPCQRAARQIAACS